MVVLLVFLAVALATTSRVAAQANDNNYCYTTKLYQTDKLEQCLIHCNDIYRDSHREQYTNTSKAFLTQTQHCLSLNHSNQSKINTKIGKAHCFSSGCAHDESVSRMYANNVNSNITFDEVYAKFPPLYHLDDYENCLLNRDGLYCLGTFDISPLNESDPTFAMIKEYSSDPYHLDRTRVHRGYCVSSRCPGLLAERNVSLHFEECASRWARARSLRITLTQLGYCHSRAQTNTHTRHDLSHRAFLSVVTLLLIINVVGTAYDILTSDERNKCQLLVVWSVRSNWRRLTASYENKDPRLSALSPFQGIRVLLAAASLFTHVCQAFLTLYINNPRLVEQTFHYPSIMLLLNGTPMIQIYTVMSSFLLAYYILITNITPNFKMLPVIIVTRIARTSPLVLLTVGYAATWWVHANSGPMWPVSVGAQSEICRAKFWTHMFYVNNLVDSTDICFLNTWHLAVDMQLYLLSAVLTIYLAHLKRRALPLLAVLVIVSSVMNGVLAYIFNWQSMVYYSNARVMSTLYRDAPSYSQYYVTPWASLPACLVGLFSAFLHFEMQEAGIKMTSYRKLKWLYYITPLAIFAWIMSGTYVIQYTEPWFVATYVAVEKSVMSILAAFIMIGMINGLGGWLQRFLSWRGWQTPARLSLAATVVHWCVTLTITAGRQLPLTTSIFYIAVDWFAVLGLSFALAVPLYIMVEIPIQRFVNLLMLRKC